MFLIYGDNNAGRKGRPYVVYTLVGINLLVFFLEVMSPDAFALGNCVVPYEISHGVDLVTDSAPADPHTIPQFPAMISPKFNLLSAMFLHGSLLHLLGNMLYLWVFGDQIEDRFGRVRFVLFYLLCGLTASAAHIFIDPESKTPMLGASGAIAGVLGVYWMLYPRNRVKVIIYYILEELPASWVLGFWFMFQCLGFLGGAEQGVAYAAHIGGFIGGLGLLWAGRIWQENQSAVMAFVSRFRRK